MLLRSVPVAQVSVAGGCFFIANIDLFDPYPETSGGLVRPFELLVLGSMPWDWFEIELSFGIIFNIRLTVGIIVFGQVIPVLRMKLGFSIVILGPFKLKPAPFTPIGGVDSSSGLLDIDLSTGNDLTCESKGGSIGEEELQCWESSNDVNPKIMSFKNVKKLGGGGSRRRLGNDVLYDGGRQLQSAENQFNCVLSETDMSGLSHISINYERCQVRLIL